MIELSDEKDKLLSDFEQEIKWKDAQIENMQSKLGATCESCKHASDVTETSCYCNNGVKECVSGQNHTYFSCNKWEARSK